MTDVSAPSNVAAFDVPHRPGTRRRVVRWTLVLLVLATVIGVPTWWQTAARSAHLDAAGEFQADHAWTSRAGDTTEMCFAVQPGSSLKFGFGVHNGGSHDVSIAQIMPILPVWSQQVTYTLESWKDGFEALPEEHPFRQFVMRPGDTVMFYLSMQIPTTYPPSNGKHIFFDRVQTRVNILGITRILDMPIGWFVGLDFVNAGAQPCAPTPPVA